MRRSRRRNVSHVSSATVDAMEKYSTSTLKWATMDCFLALHETQLAPRKVQKLVVEQRVRASQPSRHQKKHISRVYWMLGYEGQLKWCHGHIAGYVWQAESEQLWAHACYEIDIAGNIWPSEGQVLQTTNKSTIVSGIGIELNRLCSSAFGRHGSGNGFAFTHGSSI